MSEDSELVRLSKEQQAELMDEIGKVARSTGELKNLVDLASYDARVVVESVIGPKIKSFMFWLKALVAVIPCATTAAVWVAVLWLDSKYVTLGNYERDRTARDSALESKWDSAWDKQIVINVKGAAQMSDLAAGVKLNNQSIDDIKYDIKELERILKRR